MRIRAGWWAFLGLLAAVPAGAQQVPVSLTLEDALEIARHNNPTYLQTANDEALADWEVRQAYGQLLPSASANGSLGWQGSGEQQFGAITLGDLGFGNLPSYYTSSYGLSVGLSVSLATILGPSQAKAQRDVTSARIRGAEARLVNDVTNAYIDVLRQREALRLSEQQLESARFNLRLAQGQLEVGTATPIDVGQAEVQVGRAEVAVLQARFNVEARRMALLQRMGVPVDGGEPSLTTAFELIEPSWTVEELMAVARERYPDLVALQESERAAGIGVSQARSAYLPSLSLSTGWSGFTREASSTEFQILQAQAQVAGQVASCNATNDLYSRLAQPLPPRDCTQFAFTDAMRRSIVDANDQFPFAFQKSPLSLRLGLSIPIFQGLSRQRNLEAAKVQREDVRLQIRETELMLHAGIAASLGGVETGYQSALLERRNRELAEQQLRLARERYQLGAITFVDLVLAQTVLAQAERDEVASIFAYHDAVTGLEALVGTSLR